MRKNLFSAFTCTGTLLLGLGTADRVAAASCPTSKTALLVWYLAWDENYDTLGGTDAAPSDRSALLSAINAYSGPPINEVWSIEEHDIIAIPNSFNLASLPTAMSGKGIVFFWSHGLDGGVNLEYHATESAANTARTTYTTTGGYQDDDVIVRGPLQGVNAHPYTLRVMPSGISRKLNTNDATGLVYPAACFVGSGVSSWTCAVFIGYQQDPTYRNAGSDLRKVAGQFGCMLPGSNTIGAAITSDMTAATGINYTGDWSWTLSCNCSCDNPAARFPRTGAFEDKVWGQITTHSSAALSIVGFHSRDDWPLRGTVVREVKPMENDGQHVYAESGLQGTGYSFFCWTEEEKSGRRSWSEPFEVTTRPDDWDDIVAAPRIREHTDSHDEMPTTVREVWFSEDGTVLSEKPASKTADPHASSNPYQGTDIFLLSMSVGDAGRLATEKANLEAIDPSWIVRTYGCAPRVTVAAQEQTAKGVRDLNIAYNNWCAQHPGECTRTYPETPIMGLIGSRATSPDEVEFATFPDSYDRCWGPTGAGNCSDAGAGADFLVGSSPFEDLPVYLVPAATQGEVANLRASALRYEDPTHLSRIRTRAIFLLGDRYHGAIQDGPNEAFENLEDALTEEGVPAHKLHASSYSAGSYAARRADFGAWVNAGASLIAGVGGVTSPLYWPGDFAYLLSVALQSGITRWESLLTTPQTVLALLPSCFSALDPFDDRSLAEKGLFASPSGTTIGFALAHMNAGYDFQHALWLEIVGLAYRDAAVGTPWPRIIFDAKYRAAAQYPALTDYLRSAVSLGTCIRKRPAPTISDVKEEEEGEYPINESVLRLVVNGRTQPTFEFVLQRADEVLLVVHDARGRAVATVYSQRAEAGWRQVTWNGRDRNGNLMSSGVYFAKLHTRQNGEATARAVIVR